MQIKSSVTFKQTINRSEFICLLHRCFTIDQAKALVAKAKEDYPQATHYCYAYLLDHHQYSKSNDDGEPAGTAGSPILQTLLKNDVDNIIAIVIRYYGGIKLGAGGLIRAYGSSCALALQHAIFTTFQTVHFYRVEVDYERIGKVNHIVEIHGMTIENTEYDQQVVYTISTILEDAPTLFKDGLSNQCKIHQLEDQLVEVMVKNNSITI